MPASRTWLLLGALNGLLAVAAGAFGAHGLEGRVAETELAAFRTAASYQMYHALALLGVAWRAESAGEHTSLAVAGWSFLIGMFLFCGSLYVLGITASRALVWVTPLGGMAFMAGWAALGWSALRTGK